MPYFADFCCNRHLRDFEKSAKKVWPKYQEGIPYHVDPVMMGSCHLLPHFAGRLKYLSPGCLRLFLPEPIFLPCSAGLLAEKSRHQGLVTSTLYSAKTLLRPRSIWTIFYQPITKSAEIQKYFYPSYQFQVHPALGLGNYCVNYQCFPQPDVGTSLPDKGEVHSTALKNAFQPLKKIGRAQFQPLEKMSEQISKPLEHIFDPSKRSVEHMSIKPPQKTCSNTILTPPKDCLGTFSTPEKGQWSTCPCPTLLKNWLIGDEEVEEWVKEWIPCSTVNTTLGKFFYILHFACPYSEGLLKNILAKHLCCISRRWW